MSGISKEQMIAEQTTALAVKKIGLRKVFRLELPKTEVEVPLRICRAKR